jgi:prepilin-type N-terminal cleavage/methylation domain-containing protein
MKSKGFTLIELLVVVAIIGVLSSIVLSSLNDARARARDARRQTDMRTIYNALVQYELDRGFVPITSSYGESNNGGWDNSAVGGFLTFLVDDGYLSSVPIDPLNVDSGGESNWDTGDYHYKYFCYSSTSFPALAGVRLEYRRESDGLIRVWSALYPLGNVNSSSDGYFDCGSHS